MSPNAPHGGEGRMRPDLIVSAAQFWAGTDVDKNLETISSMARRASERGSHLLVLPEASMYSWNSPVEDLAEAARRHSIRFFDTVARIAREENLAIIAPGYAPSDDGRPWNRMVAFDSGGTPVAVYDKVHLYDAYSYLESNTVRPGQAGDDGSEFGLFDIEGWRIGMLNCYDIRFPEMSRALVDGGADILAIGSAWVVGHRKEFHFKTLARARAIENTVFLAAATQHGEFSIGGSALYGPLGDTLASAELDRDLITAKMRDEVLSEARRLLPVLENRRYSWSPTAR
ncbi:nitrilase-related carbon-nitrogen hydrolase [Leucobacter tenebrionis]|uniref:nitrilase-related carbon-nitrogen hydrolase n=1 Tax=Leucobacter tenebrionis TaxID=2873270 RepID=UPI001CA73597|nr:nitrilase-related carbon-nitrogen hydrolase [Leucobacter tenebrionis]QZY50887.1 carbon-nitrogen hydrolase [Leucobacter tenebrionis]